MSNFTIRLNFGSLVDYEITTMNDQEGVFIPFHPNGIVLSKSKITLKVNAYKMKQMKYGYTHCMYPIRPKWHEDYYGKTESVAAIGFLGPIEKKFIYNAFKQETKSVSLSDVLKK